MTQNASRALVFELLDGVLRSWWTIIAGLCFGGAGAAIALHYIPKVYQAHATIRVTPPKISQEFVRTTTTDDLAERLMVLREAVFNDALLAEALPRHFNVSQENLEGLTRSVRSRLRVETDPLVAGLFQLTYKDEDPLRAADMVNTLTQLCIEENTRSRRQSTGIVTEEMENQLREAKAKLDTKQRELTSFLARHSVETTEYLDFNRNSLSASRRDLEDNREKRRDLEEQLRRLQSEQSAWSTTVLREKVPPGASVNDPALVQLRRLTAELEALKINYHEDHPEVQKKTREIEDLKARMLESPVTDGDSETAAAAPKSPLEREIETLKRQIASLDREEGRLIQDQNRYRSSIHSTPSSQVQRSKLEGEEEALKKQVEALQTKMQDALSGQRLEERQQGAQLEVVDAARPPGRPAEPDPLQVYLVGLAVGLVLFVAPLPAGRWLNPVIASEAGLRTLTDIPVLVSIPRVLTEDTRNYGRRRLIKNVGLSLLSTVLLAAVFAIFRP